MAASKAPLPDGTNHNGDPSTYLHRAEGNDLKTQRVMANLDLMPSKRYVLPKKRTFAPQYAHIYFCRLRQLRSHVEVSARAAFGPASPTLRYAKSIVDASGDASTNVVKTKSEKDEKQKKAGNISAKREGKEDMDKKPDINQGQREKKLETVLVGIVFRDMKGKPSILSMYDQPSAHSLIPDPPSRATAPFAAPDDKVFLEDENARCTLDLSSLHADVAASLLTGLVVAVRGREDKSTGAFLISAVAHVGAAPLPSLHSTQSQEDCDENPVVCLVSSPVGPARELLLEEIRGTLDDAGIEGSYARSVVQMIVAGNVVARPPPGTTGAVSTEDKDILTRRLRDSDAFLSAVAATLPVAIMPGVNDATNALLPQQPMHRCLLPSASRSENLSRVPNPFACRINGRLFVGTSGQNVDDIAMYDCVKEADENKVLNGEEGKDQKVGKGGAGGDDEYRANGETVLDILELLVTNRHLAPTCPDTLGAYPFTESDPFVLEETPHVFFVGNQKEFATRLVKVGGSSSQDCADGMEVDGETVEERFVRLICLPKFVETGQAVFVDVNSLEVSIREFSLTM